LELVLQLAALALQELWQRCEQLVAQVLVGLALKLVELAQLAQALVASQNSLMESLVELEPLPPNYSGQLGH
jgi:hypothetical protein